VTETGETGLTITLSPGILSGYTRDREFTYGQIETVEVRTCCRDHAWAYPTLAGVLVGGLLGAYAGEGVVCTDTSVLGLPGDEKCEIQGTAFWWGILGGAAAGFVVGKAAFREKWEAIPIRDGSGATLSPLVDFGAAVHASGTLILGARIHL